MALGAGITLFQSFLPRIVGKEVVTYLVIGGMVLVTGVFAWAYASITCPACNLKIFWYSITKEGLGTWFTWLINLEKCPGCEKQKNLSATTQKRERSKARR